MKRRAGRVRSAAVIALVALSHPPSAHAQTPLGTFFTYQGRLSDGGSPATGTYDLVLTVFDTASSGVQVGPTVVRDDVVVANGLFTVAVDFGSTFAGSKRWIEIGVRPGSSISPHTILVPRQELTPSPNALFSASAPWAGVSGKPAGFADGVDNDTPGWNLGGNAGTNPATSFIGTTDSQPFELRVNNVRSLRIEPGVGTGDHRGPNTVLGSENNFVFPGVSGATVAGGGTLEGNPAENTVSAHFGTVGGGSQNLAGALGGDPVAGSWATVAGGQVNHAGANYAAVGGGFFNWATGQSATVGGGQYNRATANLTTIGGGADNETSVFQATVAGGGANHAIAYQATIGGGGDNVASGEYSTVPGGLVNQAGGRFSFAAGFHARVRDAAQAGDFDGDQGTFVWADSTEADFRSTGPDQFLIRTAGGVGINTTAPSPGGLTVAAPGKITFGQTTRQMIDLWGSQYGIGVQSGTTYFRTDFGFAWFQGGTHSDPLNDPGGGIRLMRLHESGNLFVRGTLNPGGADFAEMLPAEAGLEPGDVLAIGPDGRLVLSTTPYQDSLAGVYSTKPGLVGGAADGESTAGSVPLAVAGVVPVKVTDEGGPIAAGDALTSSSTPGHAMKAAKVRVGGIAFFPSGVVIGKALGPLTGGHGVLRALVVLQ